MCVYVRVCACVCVCQCGCHSRYVCTYAHVSVHGCVYLFDRFPRKLASSSTKRYENALGIRNEGKKFENHTVAVKRRPMCSPVTTLTLCPSTRSAIRRRPEGLMSQLSIPTNRSDRCSTAILATATAASVFSGLLQRLKSSRRSSRVAMTGISSSTASCFRSFAPRSRSRRLHAS